MSRRRRLTADDKLTVFAALERGDAVEAARLAMAEADKIAEGDGVACTANGTPSALSWREGVPSSARVWPVVPCSVVNCGFIATHRITGVAADRTPMEIPVCSLHAYEGQST